MERSFKRRENVENRQGTWKTGRAGLGSAYVFFHRRSRKLKKSFVLGSTDERKMGNAVDE